MCSAEQVCAAEEASGRTRHSSCSTDVRRRRAVLQENDFWNHHITVHNAESCNATCRASAYAALSEYVLLRRRAAAQGIAAAAQTGGDGGTVLHQLPEFLIPYFIQVSSLPSEIVLGFEPGQADCATVAKCLSVQALKAAVMKHSILIGLSLTTHHLIEQTACCACSGCDFLGTASSNTAKYASAACVQGILQCTLPYFLCRFWRTIQTSQQGVKSLPARQDAAEEEVTVYQPFSRMQQLASSLSCSQLQYLKGS